ncbi:FAD-dependent oxidoreductase [Actinoalloteichus spitiensis]|uniref:FAD-dependent oxidoreductase n=1 Tax=Actinoalloteichus spitiensis TaxID=252394 RepID=UPI0012F677F5|nr:NAD(P)/FAD-dependent oxidoreductase [Actinoalloteichus spitiensis]
MGKSAEIAGAGFAGLTVATELARLGWRVQVHESADRPRTFGAGIFLWDNGLHVLRELGVVDRVLAGCHEPVLWEERTATGERIGVRPLAARGGLRLVTLPRQRLMDALLAAAGAAGVRVRTGSRAVGADPAGALVTAGGRRWEADLVVGAEGIRSTLRASLGVPTEHVVFSAGACRLLVPRDRAPRAGEMWQCYLNFSDSRSQRRVLYVPCGNDVLYLLLGAEHTDPALRRPLDPAPWCATFPPLRSLLSELPATPRFDRYEALRLTTWSVGRVGLVGDAAHAMPPTLGQGAGTALANSLALARSVDETGDVVAGLRAWEAAQRPVVDLTLEESVRGVSFMYPGPGAPGLDGWPGEAFRIAAHRVPPRRGG